MTPPIAAALGERIATLRYEHLPADVVHWAKVGLLDTVGVTLAGCGGFEDAPRMVEQVLGAAGGRSLVFGSSRRIGMLDAALVNGTAAHALDFDDCNNTVCGHPSSPITPALFALADDAGASGRAFVTAYVAGVETECKIGLGAGLAQYTHGWHPTATLGVFGAAASCARLLDLDAARTATALAIAASLAGGVKANFGTMTKPLHVGHTARNGLLAALLARAGFTANDEAFEHPQGYLELFNGAGNFDAQAIVDAWGEPFDLVRPGLAIKQYPCCASTHPAIDALLDLVRTHALRPDDVVRVQTWIHPRRLRHTNRPDPRSALDAKFSVQYCLARALVDGAVRTQDFEPEAVGDPRVRALLPRIEAAPYTADDFPAENHFAGAVKVTLSDGRVLDARVDQALGRSIDKPLPPPLLAAKFRGCASRVLDAAAVDALHDALSRFETHDDVRTLTRMMEPTTPGTPANAGA